MTIRNEIEQAIAKYYSFEKWCNIEEYMIITFKRIEESTSDKNREIVFGYNTEWLTGKDQYELDQDNSKTFVSFGIVSLGYGRFLVFSCNEWIPTNAHELIELFNNHFKDVLA